MVRLESCTESHMRVWNAVRKDWAGDKKWTHWDKDGDKVTSFAITRLWGIGEVSGPL